MTDLELPARIFYDSTTDHHERLRRLEAALAASDDEDEQVNLRQYIVPSLPSSGRASTARDHLR